MTFIAAWSVEFLSQHFTERRLFSFSIVRLVFYDSEVLMLFIDIVVGMYNPARSEQLHQNNGHA